MSGRLILAIINTLLEEGALVVIVLLGLPRLDIQVPIPGLIVLMAAWGAYSIFTYRMGSRALSKRQVIGLPDMIGSKGEVVNRLAPEGLVRIKGELWIAESASGEMESGEEVLVVGQDRLKLFVRASSTTNDLERNE